MVKVILFKSFEQKLLNFCFEQNLTHYATVSLFPNADYVSVLSAMRIFFWVDLHKFFKKLNKCQTKINKVNSEYMQLIFYHSTAVRKKPTIDVFK